MKPLLLTALLIASAAVFAQENHSPRVYKDLRLCDSLLFDLGFNTCDLQQFEDLISNDFEFYHDQAGSTLSKTAFIRGVREGICQLSYRPRRELVEGSQQVYLLEKNGVLYGAVQTGEHRFYAIEEGQPEKLTSTARFTHVWLLESGVWKLARGLSYDHREPPGLH